jgi:hypothetical protein
MANLYRHFNAQGQLLYVGLSLNAVARLAQHREKSFWFSQISRVEIEWHKSREHAAYAEALAIRDEAPLYNKAKPVPRDPDAPPPVPSLLDRRPEANLILEALKKCPEPVVQADYDGPRIFGYLCVGRQYLNRGIGRLRNAGVPDNWMFIDVVDYGGRRQPNLVKLLRSAQHKGTRIMCEWLGDFTEAREILKERGVTLHKIARQWSTALE